MDIFVNKLTINCIPCVAFFIVNQGFSWENMVTCGAIVEFCESELRFPDCVREPMKQTLMESIWHDEGEMSAGENIQAVFECHVFKLSSIITASVYFHSWGLLLWNNPLWVSWRRGPTSTNPSLVRSSNKRSKLQIRFGPEITSNDSTAILLLNRWNYTQKACHACMLKLFTVVCVLWKSEAETLGSSN